MRLYKIILTIATAISTHAGLFAQQKELKKFPAQLSFIYPIGTSGTIGEQYQYNFSLNALAGTVGAVNGCEIGGLVNLNLMGVKGVQIGGITNLIKGNVKGLQIGGVINLSDTLNGLQIGGITNISKKAEGLVIGGIVHVTGDTKGFLIGGITNISRGNTNGFQLAGIINKTKVLNGFQLGLINIADSVEKGISLGLINIYKKGFYDEWEVSFSDYANVKMSYKAGLERFYTIYSVGANFIEDKTCIAGLGLGHISKLSNRISFQPEATYHMYFPDNFRNVKFNQSTHLKLAFVYNISEGMGISVGPSIYARNQQKENSNSDRVSSIKPIYSHTSKYHDNKVELGIGLSIGLIFR